tara:strand:- start:2347 stop:3669 length:1323 start_codon:yes stop_codon:yes gene_type:complete
MSNTTGITPAQLLGESKFSGYQLRAIVICFLIAALDGFDTQSIAFVAPALRHLWEIAPEQFGPLFAAGLIGTMVGAIVLSSLADRFGRKPLIIFSTLLFGGMSLLCATATSVDTLFMYRLIAGFGLGGAIPNILALVSEYAPHRVRSTVIVATFTGFPFGAVVGGIASSKIIPAAGWEMVFILGGILPLALLPFVFAWVPESLRYLLRRDDKQAKARRILERIEPGVTTAKTIDYSTDDVHAAKPVRNLFAPSRVAWTVLLWLLTFTVLLLGYFLINWTPLLLVDAGVPHQKAILGVVALNLGGIIGSLFIGRLSDKQGPFKVVATAFGIGAIAIAVLGFMIDSSVPVLLSIVFVIGLFVFGGQLNVTALAANYYPLDMRSTGIGWSMGFGRVGSFVGPLIGGALVAYGLHQGQMFLVAAVPAAIACALVIAMACNKPKN